MLKFGFNTAFFVLTFSVSLLQANEQPNFVIFVADDMAWNDCGAYGHPHIRTPNIDKLADEGVRFNRAYLTCSSCSPSRCSMLTGRYPHSTDAGELHLPLPAEQVMVTKALGDQGYWTAVVGKWHLGEKVADQVDYRRGSPPAKMGDAWVQSLRDRPKDAPFFLWAAHSDPHRGYKKGAVDPPHTVDDVVVPPFFPDTPEVRDDIALYYDEISRFDEHIGMVLKELEAQGLTENTLVLVISDNGRPFPHCKTNVNVPGVRTPFVLRWPAKVKAGAVTNQLVSTVDIAPTLLELAGAKPLATMQGESFKSALTDQKTRIREFAFAEHNWHDYKAFERAVHTEKYCYVRNWLTEIPSTPPADAVNSPTYKAMKRLQSEGKLTPAQAACFQAPRAAEFLYDVEADPHCLRNLADDPSHAETLVRLRGALTTWQKQTGDEFPGADKVTPDGFDRATGKRVISAAHPSLQKPKTPKHELDR